jgi:hypothetical protein
MIPDRRNAYEPDEPDESTVGDRLFSQLPFDDGWRLIREALRSKFVGGAGSRDPADYHGRVVSPRFLLIHHLFYRIRVLLYGRIPLVAFSSIVASVSIAFLIVGYKVATISFWFWFALQAVAIWVFLCLWQYFDFKAGLEIYQIDRALREIEEIMLQESRGGPIEPA